MKTKLIAAATLALCTCLPGLGWAADLATPKGEIVLTVKGNISIMNAEDSAQFDMDMLAALPASTFKTTTIWTEGENEFTGVSIKALSEALGMTGTRITATAINDYAVEIPMSDAVEGGPMLAYAMNGEAMSVRDKGPLWVIYPFDANTDYQTEVVYSRSIWQLDRLEAVE